MQLRQPERARSASDLATRGAAAVDSGDLAAARKYFSAAVQADRRSAQHRFNLAIVLEALEDISGAADQLTTALRLDPGTTSASRRLCWLLARGTLPEHTRLDAEGLRVALAHDTADRDLLAAAILHHLARMAPMRAALERGRSGAWHEAVRGLCLRETGALFRDPLLLEVLRRGVVSSPDVERLLTVARSVLLLELSPSRFNDPALMAFAVALMQQCWLNEFVWTEAPDETRALSLQSIDMGSVLEGHSERCHTLLLHSMYRRPEHLLGPDITAGDLREIRPHALREALAARLTEERSVREHATRIPRLGAISNETSRRVAGQYEAAPYPRWSSVLTFRTGQYLKKLGGVFPAHELSFLQRPFEVLIAGCGTGRQAVSAAVEYGAHARVSAMDISATSLGYASLMAERFGMKNLSFLHADLRDIDTIDASYLGRYHVIECIGVLHHMDDPLEGLRALRRCLAPGGIMLLGLYSAIARRSLLALKGEPLYPGAGCDDAELREYRRHLLSLPEGAPGTEFRRGLDFYSSSGFRDFFLHVSERWYTLPEISQCLADTGLVFGGFFDIPFERLKDRYPAETWPGSLERWAAYEADHPQLFARMYQFWCTASPP